MRALAGRRVFAAWLAVAAATPATTPTLTPEENRRGTEQTFLTFPEWFLVFSPAEYAAFVQKSPPSGFPFFGHVSQFWQSYRAVHHETRAYPTNTEYHVMIVVIGVSTTVEYGLRLAYETLVGRLTELTTGYGTTAEDRLAAQVAQDYVDFIRVRPWYEYDFADKLRKVWQAPWWGEDMLRKWERKYALTSEYGAKALYGWLIGRGTQASFGAELPVTVVRTSALPEGLPARMAELKVLAVLPEGGALLAVPRYQAFTDHAVALARAGVRFEEIAGNRTVILVSALVPAGWTPPAGLRPLFFQPILTDPSRKRVALVVPVEMLHGALLELAAPPQAVEHVFDY